MKIIDSTEATAPLAEYALNIANGPVVVTSDGRPVAALVPIENADVETVSLSTNSAFMQLIERSRTIAKSDGTIAADEMRRRFSQ